MKLTHIAATSAVILTCAAAAAAGTNQVPLDQQQQINQAVDALLPFLPAPLVTVLAGLSVLLVPLMAIGRLMLGYRQAGLQGAVSGLLTGSNVPKVVQDCPLMTPPKAKSPPLACIAIAATIAALGCAHVSSHQTTRQTPGRPRTESRLSRPHSKPRPAHGHFAMPTTLLPTSRPPKV